MAGFTPGQRKTALVLAAFVGVCLLLSLCMLGWEFYTLTLDDSATISETIWVLWAHQPGPIALVLVVVAFISGALFGHWFWESRGVYDDIRLTPRERVRLLKRHDLPE